MSEYILQTCPNIIVNIFKCYCWNDGIWL